MEHLDVSCRAATSTWCIDDRSDDRADRPAGPPSRGAARPADRPRPDRAGQLPLHRRPRGRHRLPGGAHRLHRRGRLRAVLRRAPRGAAVGRAEEGGADLGLEPCGLGSRDTLRLEAGMPLYGNELDRGQPVRGQPRAGREAGEGGVRWPRRPAPVQQTGPRRRLVGLVMRDDAIARHGYPVRAGGSEVGVVTSGTLSPTLGERIAMAYLPAGEAAIGGAGRGGRARTPPPRRAGKVAVLPAPAQSRQPQPRPRGAAGADAHHVPDDLRYSREHEWVRVEGSTADDRHHQLRRR